MSREYNFIYNQLVKNDKDFVGMIAYSIYKKQKVNFCQDFKKKNKRDPSTEELKTFHNSVSAGVSNYKVQAKNINEAYQKILFEKKSEEILNLYKIHLPNKKSYWHGIGQNILASFLYSLIILIIFFIVKENVEFGDLFTTKDTGTTK